VGSIPAASTNNKGLTMTHVHIMVIRMIVFFAIMVVAGFILSDLNIYG
jgi:hypothetical protein